MENTQITDEILKHFQDNSVSVIVKKYGEVHETLKHLVDGSQDKVWISSGSSYALSAIVPTERIYSQITPIQIMKAIKNDVEVRGMINSHVRDGVALVEYFSWLEKEVKNGKLVTELSGAEKLQTFRRY